MIRRFFIASKFTDGIAESNIKTELEKQTGLSYPVLSLRELVIVDGDPDGSSLDYCKHALYSEYCEKLSTEEAPKDCAVTLLYRNGRTDIYADGIKAIIAINPYNASVNVRTGKQILFSSPLTSEQYEKATEFFCDPLIYILDGTENEVTPTPENRVAEGFNRASFGELTEFKEKHNLKIDIDDMMCIQNHFLSESRDPTFAEIAVIDRFFGEDFRHTTFETVLDRVKIADPLAYETWERFIKRAKVQKTSLSGITEFSKKYRSEKILPNIDAKIRGIKIPTDNGEFLLTFVGESRNRSVTVQPYDGAASCLSEVRKSALCRLGSITDTYRISGTSDEGDFDIRAILASDGFNDYSSSVGSPCTKSTRLVSSSYREKQLEFCAALSVSKLNDLEALYERKAKPDDTVYLLGARTGLDGSVCFGENGNSGEFVAVPNSGIMNALTRFILRDDVRDLLNSLAYVGSGGIVCAIGKLGRGAVIHTEKIPSKHPGISVEELLLSESAERMIVCVSERESKKFKDLCHEENLPFAEIAEITNDDRIVVTSAKNPREVSIKTDFLLSGGTKKYRGASIDLPPELPSSQPLKLAAAPLYRVGWLKRKFSKKVRPDLESAFSEACKTIRFTADTENSLCDSTVGGGMITPPLSDKTPDSAVRQLTYNGEQLTKNGAPLCTVIALGTNPSISRSNPYKGAYLAVTEALTKAVASGLGYTNLHIAIQEYLPEYNDSSRQYGMALAALLGAYEAQTAFKIPSLGGRSAPGRVSAYKEKNSGIAAFAIGVGNIPNVITRDLKYPGNTVVLFKPECDKSGLPLIESQMDVLRSYHSLAKEGKILSAISVNVRSAASGIIEMCHASGLGFSFSPECSLQNVFDICYGSIIAELDEETNPPKNAIVLGRVSSTAKISYKKKSFELATLFELANVKPFKYPSNEHISEPSSDSDSYASSSQDVGLIWNGIPSDDYGNDRTHSLEGIRVIIPVNNYCGVAVSDVRAIFEDAGCNVDVVSYSETTPQHLIRAIERADVMYIPDGGEHPAFAKAIFKLPEVKAAIEAFRKEGGLIYGEGTGFEILLSSGLLDLDEKRIGLTDNPDKRAICHIAKIRTASLLSPIMRQSKLGKYSDTVLTGKRLRICADPDYLRELASEGRIASQLAPSDNLSVCTLEVDSISSKDGRVLGRISHALRFEGSEEFSALPIIRSIVGYFK